MSIEQNITREDFSHRGGGVELDLTTFGYEDELRANEIKVILPSRKEIEAIEECIRKVIGGHDAVKLQNHLRPVIKSMLERGATKVLLGCTELSVIFGNTTHTALVDPLSIIARELLCDSKLQK